MSGLEARSRKSCVLDMRRVLKYGAGREGRYEGEQQELCMLCLHLSLTFCMNVDNANWQLACFFLAVCACVSFNIIAYLRAAYVCVCVCTGNSCWFRSGLGCSLLLVWSVLL